MKGEGEKEAYSSINNNATVFHCCAEKDGRAWGMVRVEMNELMS